MARKYREGAKQFYNSKAWIKCRDGYMQSQHYLCERCGGLATICHHKIWLDETKYSLPEYSLNWDNLEAICQTCHNQEHFSSDIVSDGLTFDSKGNVIENIVDAIENLIVVLGYPASGKTTYVNDQASMNDVTLDMDELRKVLIQQDRSKNNVSIGIANDMMNMTLNNIINGKYKTNSNIYFIRTYMDIETIKTLLSRGATVVLKERNKEDCIKTVEKQGRIIQKDFFDKVERMINEINREIIDVKRV